MSETTITSSSDAEPLAACPHEWKTIGFDFAISTITYRCPRCRAEKSEKAGPTKAKERERSRARRGRAA